MLLNLLQKTSNNLEKVDTTALTYIDMLNIRIHCDENKKLLSLKGAQYLLTHLESLSE